LQRLFSKLDGHALSVALSTPCAPAAIPVPVPQDDAVQGVAVDGTGQRGRLPFQDGGCPVHALTAFCHEHGVVLAHEPIVQGSEKAEAELTVAPALLARIAWPGRVLTGDALFCQRHLCQQVLDAGGDYLLLVKENQPTLFDDIRLLFDPPPSLAGVPLTDQREAQTLDRGHGRRDEVRHLVASTDLTDYLDWPGVAQVFRLRRTWHERGAAKQVLHYGITSLAPETGAPERLLALKRGHWAIENGLHRVKDVSLGEDQRLIHQGQGPTVLALLREASRAPFSDGQHREVVRQDRRYRHGQDGREGVGDAPRAARVRHTGERGGQTARGNRQRAMGQRCVGRWRHGTLHGTLLGTGSTSQTRLS
jgi:predicted transposase YbfD/YdcC